MEVTAKIVRKLDKMIKRDSIDEDTTLSYLHRLRDTEMTLDILTKTGIGIVINKIRKQASNAEITTLGKQLIKQWKKLVPDKASEVGSKRSPPVSGDDSSQHATSDAKRVRRSADDEDYRHDSDTGSNHAPVAAARESSGRPFFMSKSLDTDDPVRLKAREMIKNALESTPPPPGAFEAEYLATQIENSIFGLFKTTDPKYKHRVRTRVMNLRDSNNPNLRLNVFMGHVRPERLASMTSEEMASKDMKELRDKYNKETIDDHQMAVTTGTESDILKCGKCKMNKVTYNQVQTRSADEPMTTFAYCNNCGHRWKFC
ncbi:unnamed protein product [Mesocestoides corti]|uniref:Transcription elongation factor n=1 Tax=Mesocestoides corti TaxID=53468 RepID=A0A0R3UFV4_MESCO|nr:unnamed protein product [Mesocestoides corti]